MTCNSAIYTVNRTSTPLEANSQVPFGGVVRRFGPAMRLEGDNIVLYQNGYYSFDISATMEATAAGPLSLMLYVNGAPYLGAMATETAAAAGDAVNLKIATTVRVTCDKPLSLSLYLGDAGATPVNIASVGGKL